MTNDRLLNALLFVLAILIVTAGLATLAMQAAAAEGPTPAWATDAGVKAAAPAPAPAPAPVPPPAAEEIDVAATAQGIYNAVRGGRWMVAAGLALLVAVWAARRWLGELIPWLRTDRGGVALALALALMGEVATGFAAGQAPSFGGFAAALAAAWTASGAWTQIRRLVAPPDKAAES